MKTITQAATAMKRALCAEGLRLNREGNTSAAQLCLDACKLPDLSLSVLYDAIQQAGEAD